MSQSPCMSPLVSDFNNASKHSIGDKIVDQTKSNKFGYNFNLILQVSTRFHQGYPIPSLSQDLICEVTNPVTPIKSHDSAVFNSSPYQSISTASACHCFFSTSPNPIRTTQEVIPPTKTEL